ncbi:hypothetical protein Goe2_c15100 [Bacillus phage vB_BsuM-Goe2]|uniref:Uncharacterized protein n=1 Tax=Bacillus phage vB_BsuM-Goe2 TaxID=1933062 RepID=A0A217EQR0_9CAUD|nr:hypothetical protein Goe2_c15100 [Bacillus phage vB_BsuM-Goe2]
MAYMCRVSEDMWIKSRGTTEEEARKGFSRTYRGDAQILEILPYEEYKKKHKINDIASPFASSRVSERRVGKRTRGKGMS